MVGQDVGRLEPRVRNRGASVVSLVKGRIEAIEFTRASSVVNCQSTFALPGPAFAIHQEMPR